jgi:hypothetical protein
MTYLADQMTEKLGPNAIVHVAVCNRTRAPDIIHNPTHDGVDAGGERLAKEISEVVTQHQARGLRFISIVGNSMGGIYSRYAIGILFDITSRTICGLEPVSFITTASPHLGLHGFVSKMLERVTSNLLYGGLTAEHMFLSDSAHRKENVSKSQVTHSIAVSWRDIHALLERRHIFSVKPVLARDVKCLPTPSAANREVMLEVRGHSAREDINAETPGNPGQHGQESSQVQIPGDDSEREVPLLVAMTTDQPWPFLSALASFRYRVAYGNTCNDPVVPYETATIACQPLKDWRVRPSISASFPHIVDDSREHVRRWPPETTDDEEARTAAGDARERDVTTMRRNLERLGWRRVSARFLRSVRVGDRQAVLPGILGAVGVDAHNCLPVVRPLLNGLGRDAVSHVCTVLAEHRHGLAAAAAAAAAAGDLVPLGAEAWDSLLSAGDGAASPSSPARKAGGPAGWSRSAGPERPGGGGSPGSGAGEGAEQ